MRLLLALPLAALLAGCAAPPRPAAAPAPAPTVAGAFQRSPVATPRPLPTAPPIPTRSAAPAPAERIEELVVYDEALAVGWSLDASERVAFDLADTSRAQSGERAIRVSPERGFGRLFFTVGEDAPRPIRREEVVGVSVWLNSGDAEVGPSDLALTVVGSNARPHWRPLDDSVAIDGRRFFSETRLYYLGVSRAIPPDTWVELVVWLDDLPYDPDYTYVTGVYLKNDREFTQTVYVDRVALLLAPEE